MYFLYNLSIKAANNSQRDFTQRPTLKHLRWSLGFPRCLKAAAD